jgi:hypothetical protein
MRVTKTAFALFMLASAVPTSAGVDEPPQLPPEVAYVASGGMWEAGDRYGSYRLVVVREGDEHSATSAYVEWWQFDESRSHERKVDSASIVPLRRDLSRLIQNVRFDYAVKDAGEFVLDLNDRNSGEQGTLRLRLGKPGEWQLVGVPASP